jgi:signal peptidase I
MKKGYVSQEYSVQKGGKNLEEGTKGSRTTNRFVIAFFSVSLLLSVSVVSFSIMFFVASVSGSSMMQTLNANYTRANPVYDNVLVNRVVTPKVGDIIVVRYYWGPHDINEWDGKNRDGRGPYNNFIKRLIAVEGQVVHFAQDNNSRWRLFVDGDMKLETEYLDPIWGHMTQYAVDFVNILNNPGFRTHWVAGSVFTDPEDGLNKVRVPAGHVFYMGDNRGGGDYSLRSYDSTAFGPQPAEFIEGVRADTIYYNESIGQYLWRKLVWVFTFGRVDLSR